MNRVGRNHGTRTAWWIFLLACLGGIVAYQLTSAGAGKDLIYSGFGLASASAIVVGVRLHRPAVAYAWYLMVAGQLLTSIGDGMSSWITDVQHVYHFPTVADVLYVSAYPLIAAGMFMLIRARRPLKDAAGFLDSAILTAALGLLAWVLLVGPAIANHHESISAAAVAAAYPAADIILLGLLIGLVTTPGSRTASLTMLVLAVVVLIVVDLAAAEFDLLASGATAIDFLWLTSYALWGAAALHPSMRSVTQPTTQVRIPFTRTRLTALAVAVLVAPGILVAEHLRGSAIDIWAIAVGSAVMSLVVLARIKVAIDQMTAADRERIKAQRALARQATHDALTGLPNRARANELIAGALSRARPVGSTVGLIFLDLDGFKRVNDALGHPAGDDLLRVVAGRLGDNVRAGDVACRLGGDEFVVLLEDIVDEQDAIEVGDRLIRVVSTPIVVAGDELVTVGASIGVAFSHDHGTDPDVLLLEADAALYRAKQSGRGRVQVFDAKMRGELHARTRLEHDLAAAINADQLVLHYQPIVHLSSGAVQGYEALIRWPRDGRLLPPSDFIPLAEQSDLICELGAWVLRHATRQLARWSERTGSPSPPVAVNISARHVSRPRILADVRRAVAAANIDPAQLVLEITETALADGAAAVKHLEELRHDGMAISIDDFGTGYSSIARLEHLPIDILKVDRHFLDDTDVSAGELVRMIVQTGHALGFVVIAEGVETEEQFALLRSIDCDAAQGYLLGPPVDPETIDVRERGNAPPLVVTGVQHALRE